MSDKTWTVVGTSVQNGKKTLRLANGTAAAREKILVKAGCTDVRLFDLPEQMTAAAAEAWLALQGDTVPARVAKPAAAPAVRKARAMPVPAVASADSADMPHEELGYAASGMSREYWQNQSVLVRQEACRNAALAANLQVNKGDYPELEDWLELQGVFTRNDGTVYEAA
jgi:hypothetical protein